MIHVLQRASIGELLGSRATEHDHGYPGPLRVGDRGYHVGDTGPGGHCANTGLPGDSGPSVCSVSRGLLVPNVHDADLLVDAPVVNRLDVPAAQGEKMRRPLAPERLRYEPAAVDHPHRM